MPADFEFPQDFQWGSATAAYQIEGAVGEDGRGQSIWDAFAHTPGKILNNDNGDTACDHYHRWKEDLQIVKALGHKTYRFSLAWPRLLPEGRGKANQAGIDFYNRIIDELLRLGIQPLITLYHWDLPTALSGAWLNRATVQAFEEFTHLAACAFGDRVKNWVTINEPWCASFLSYKIGIHAPGLNDPFGAFTAAHHLLLAHGQAVKILRTDCAGAHVGIALNLSPFYPQTESAADREVARYGDGELARWFLDPLYGRQYPADILADLRHVSGEKFSELPFIQPGDMQAIAEPTDFLAINYYSRNVVRAIPQSPYHPLQFEGITVPDAQRTDMGWEIYPQGLYEVLARVYWNYKPGEIIISENGASYGDEPGSDGQVHDQRRIDYLRAHLQQIARALQSGIPVSGYYLWSLLDNFEWSLGYSQRFGIVHVNYATQKRTVKDSALWYRDVIAKNAIPL